ADVRRAVPPSSPMPVEIADEEEFEEDASVDVETGSRSLPVPEPEAQPIQRPTPNQQRQVRRLERNSDLSRASRNSPSGDVIDIPAFLRKR
ncbi:MAG: cell division protein FtsZ, partial [Ktedonobacteraceae bacterium]|nr:cell division protein FtsZ [Ktedonobacteraceae bacterium]